VVKRVGWGQITTRMASILDDPHLGLSVDRISDRQEAWEVFISQGPKSWGVRS
jgi:hypothetical protein